MATIFSQVTADIADDLEKRFPNDFDFRAMIEKVSEDSGVSLHFSDNDSEHMYKLKGFWLSIEKAYSLLATTLGMYGTRLNNELKNSNTVEKYEVDNEKIIKSAKHSAEVNAEPKTKTKRLKSKVHECETSKKQLIVTQKNTKVMQQNIDKKTDINTNTRSMRSKRHHNTCDNIPTLINTNGNCKISDVNSSNIGERQTQQIVQNIQLKNVSKQTTVNTTCANIKVHSKPDEVQKRKRGRPKKSVTCLSANLLKQKIYKYTKYKNNFVRRPFVARPVRTASHIKESIEGDIKSEWNNDSNEYNEDTQRDDSDLRDDDENDDISTHEKRKRGRPKRTDAEKEFPCPDCDFIALNGNMLSDHKHRTHRACPTKCDVCNKVFPNKRYMMRHRASHVEPQHCCDICGKMYKVKKSMQEHRKTHDVGYTKPVFECSQCTKTFCNGYILKCHIKSEHLGEKKSFLCSRCGKSFTTKHSLQEHSNAHSGLKPHECDVCGKRFNYESALRDHKYTHTENRKFSCSVCKKNFSQRSSLKMHMRIHAVEKKFACEECGRGFTQKQALERHERVHKGFKPFVCKLCRRTFTDSSIIRRHLILVHKIHKDSNSWREDILCKIGPTKFRVEKLDASKLDCEIGIQYSEKSLQSFHTQKVEHSYSVKADDNGEGFEKSNETSTDAVSSSFTNNFVSETMQHNFSGGDRHMSSLQIRTSLVNCDSCTSSVQPTEDQQMISDEQQSNLSNDRLPNSQSSTPVIQVSTGDLWTLPAHTHIQSLPSHPSECHQILPSTHLHHEISTPIEPTRSGDAHSYQPQHGNHLVRSATPQYIPAHDVNNQMRSASVNYPTNLRSNELPQELSHHVNNQGQWSTMYAYYNHLANQFGMNLNEYHSATYNVPSQESPHSQTPQTQTQL